MEFVRHKGAMSTCVHICLLFCYCIYSFITFMCLFFPPLLDLPDCLHCLYEFWGWALFDASAYWQVCSVAHRWRRHIVLAHLLSMEGTRAFALTSHCKLRHAREVTQCVGGWLGFCDVTCVFVWEWEGRGCVWVSEPLRCEICVCVEEWFITLLTVRPPYPQSSRPAPMYLSLWSRHLDIYPWFSMPRPHSLYIYITTNLLWILTHTTTPRLNVRGSHVRNKVWICMCACAREHVCVWECVCVLACMGA